ncbi:MAG TPA: hypothetical protein VD932_02320 [Aquabacterium sp.]|nr:hypothetical protein [Aquabacterium sp.]
MSRLRAEFARLFLPDPTQPDATELVDAQGRTRALVLELAAPADWAPLQAVWQGVQADLGLPAPAIAVSGVDGLQLWFSAPGPVAVADAQRWLRGLCGRYLAGVAPHRVRVFPAVEAGAAAARDAVRHADAVPAAQVDGEKWSAFVASDLVPLFTDTPWLDIEPSEEGQAALLGRVGVMKAGWFEAVVGLDQVVGAGADAAAEITALVRSGDVSTVEGRTGWQAEAVAFLRRVMADEAAPLAVRVEAAKALLNAPEAGGVS